MILAYDHLDSTNRVARELAVEGCAAGTVVLRVRVGADGTAQQVRIQRSSGYPALDESAQDTVQRWRFVPGKRHGVATAMDYDVPIAFRLD